jgi:carboxypeptidase family protein
VQSNDCVNRLAFVRTALSITFAVAVACTTAAAQSTPRPLTVRGIAYDSLHRRPLGGAFVMIVGSSRNATSDARGNFQFDSLTPGVYTFLLQHALLDSLGLSERAERLAIQRPDEMIRLSVPSFATMWKLECGAGRPPSDSGIVFGTVRSTGHGVVAGATVRVSWVDLGFSKDSGAIRQRMGGEVRTDSAGSYAACGVPLSFGVRIVALFDSATYSRIDLVPTAERVRRRDVLLGGAGVANGTIVGTVRNATGGPVSGARIDGSGLREVRSDVQGRFVIRDAPAGTTQLDVTAIGMTPTAATVDVPTADSVLVDIEVQKATPLDTLKIRGMAPIRYRLREIADRKKLGNGQFMDSTQAERHADAASAIAELTSNRCVSRLWIDGLQVRITDISYEIRLLKPGEIGEMEWYQRWAPIEFGGSSCTLIIWTRRALPH